MVVLNTCQNIWDNQYSAANRNKIRKARKNDIAIKIDTSLAGLLKFAEVYRESMKDLNAPAYYKFSNEYFVNIFNLCNENYDLILALRDSQLIAGALFFHYGYNYHYHLAARKREYQNFPANNLILDEAVKIAHQHGCKNFHFGGGTDNTHNNSLLKFKSNFSCERGRFYIGKKIHNQRVYDEVISQLEEKSPRNKEISKNILLRYRNV